MRYGDPAQMYQQQMANSLMRQEGECTEGTGNTYNGERDADGYRTARGQFQFADGSFYDGEWFQGLRHGVGEFKYRDGGSFRGQWAMDLRHGHGKYCFANGDVVIGTWVHDRLNGVARRWVNGKSDYEEVIYKDDMLIQIAHGGLFLG